MFLFFNFLTVLIIFLTRGKRLSMLASEINAPSTCTLSRKHDTWGDTNSPVFRPPSWRDRAILSATDPCSRAGSAHRTRAYGRGGRRRIYANVKLEGVCGGGEYAAASATSRP